MYKTAYNIKQKIIAILIITVFSVVSVVADTKNIYAATNEEIQTVTENGIEYTVKTEESLDGKVITVTQSNNDTKTVIEINDEEIISTQYIDQGDNTFDKETVEIQLNEEAASVTMNEGIEAMESADAIATAATTSSSIKWNSTVKEKYKKKYWYRTGHNSSNDRDYLRIGCTAKYQLRTDNMTTYRVSQCNKYKSAINSVNTKYNKFSTYFSGTGISATAALALLVANVLYPASTLITIIMGAASGLTLTAATNAVDKFIEMKGKYEVVKDQYETIKACGTKY